MAFSLYRKVTSQKQICTTNDKPAFLFTVFSRYIRTARAPEDAHNICLSEPLVMIMKFPNREYSVPCI